MKGSGKLADPSRLKDPAGWKPLPPRGSVDIAAIEAICASEAARVLAREYKSMLKENAGRPPSKTGLDISRFGKAVNQLFLMAVTKPDTCTVRLAAVGARHHSGNPSKDGDYYANVPKGRQAAAQRSMAMAVDTPCGFRVDLVHYYDFGRTRRFESLVLPLSSAEPGVDGFLIGSSQPVGEEARIVLPGQRSYGSLVTVRDLVDIGFGVDEGFRDLVPPGFA